MNNIRKLKKKKINTVLNPQELAQQKLFQISRQQQKIQEPDICLQTLSNRIHKNVTNRPKLQRIQQVYSHRQQRVISPRITAMQSFNSFRHRSTEIQPRQLPTTYFIVIDQRGKHKSQSKQKPARIESNMIRRMAMTHRIKTRSVPNVHSTSKNISESSKQIVKKKKDVSSLLQVKNIKLQNKYPAFYQHIRIHEN